MNPKELFGNDYDYFEEVDPYNPKNTVSGVISRKSNEFYGALIINRVNNKDVTPQLIMGTPKMHYPFDSRADGTRRYAFPSAKHIEVYEKLDGTNILAYSYTDGINRYFTYKTRLRPFVGSSKFGDFYSLWNEAAKDYFTIIKSLIVLHKCNLSFELYGARNPHLVVYKVPLAFALLFGVTEHGRIIPPSNIDTQLPKPRSWAMVNADYVYNYESNQKFLEEELKQEEEGYYSGIEGTVWYMKLDDTRCIQLKCKPETIEAIHFSAGAKHGLHRNVVIATCWNALENVDSLTVDFVKRLLLEEFKPEIIEANHNLIGKCVDFVTNELAFRTKVLDAYRATGKNILLDKASIMRQLSTQFNKKDMRKVYNAIVNFG